MKEKTFLFNKSSSIWIYGHGFLGIPLYKRLTREGFKVKGFIDRNYSSFEAAADYRVIGPDSIDSTDPEDVFVISFQNIQEHHAVAESLLHKGRDRIIFLYRHSSLYPKTFEYYNALVYSDNSADLQFEFPITKPFPLEEKLELRRKSSGNYYTSEVPIQLVFSAPLEPPIEESGVHGLWKYPVASMHEYNALFHCVLTGKYNTAYLQRYSSRLKGSWRSEEQLLAARTELCGQLLEEFHKNGADFFFNSPSQADFQIQGGLFQLTDGHHRACFLSNMRQHLIPIRMTKEDYLLWKNEQETEALSRLLKKQSAQPLYTPILHPRFFGFPTRSERFGYLCATAIGDWFSRKDLSGLTVLDMDSNLSYYGRILYRLGARRITSVEKRTLLRELAIHINKIERCEDILVQDRLSGERFDIVLWINDVGTDTSGSDEWVENFSELCGHTFILKTASRNDVESKLSGKGFTLQSVLCRMLEVGKMKEVLLFEKCTANTQN